MRNAAAFAAVGSLLALASCAGRQHRMTVEQAMLQCPEVPAPVPTAIGGGPVEAAPVVHESVSLGSTAAPARTQAAQPVMQASPRTYDGGASTWWWLSTPPPVVILNGPSSTVGGGGGGFTIPQPGTP